MDFICAVTRPGHACVKLCDLMKRCTTGKVSSASPAGSMKQVLEEVQRRSG